MAVPVKKKLKARKGITFSEFVFVQDGLEEDVVLDGYDARMQIRADYGGTLISDLSLGFGITLNRNRVEIVIPPAQTIVMDVGSFLYDLEIESPDGTVIQLLYGTFTVVDSITT